MERKYSPTMAVAVGRALIAALHLMKGPFAPEAAALTIGATVAKIALGALKDRRGYAPTWALALMVISAGGAAEVLPVDATAQIVLEIANATVLPVGVSLLGALFARMLLESALPMLRIELAPREATAMEAPAKSRVAPSRARIKSRGGRRAAPV